MAGLNKRWLVLAQLRASALALDWMLGSKRFPDAGRMVERASRSALFRRFPLFAGSLSMMEQTALCARAAGVASAKKRALVQSMMFLWLARTRGYAAQLIDLESLDSLLFAPDVPRQAVEKPEAAQSRAATMAGKQ